MKEKSMKCFFNHEWTNWNKPEKYLKEESFLDMGIKSATRKYGFKQTRFCKRCGIADITYLNDKKV